MHDARNPVLQKPCHHLGFTNDRLDIGRDNMPLYIHTDRQELLLMILTRYVQAVEQGFVPFVGYLFCDDN